MDLIANLPFVGGALASLLAFVVVLGVVVFIHEYGHYIVGRWCGIKADVFSLGFGPVLTGWTDRRGTRWQVAALPLGGYVRFKGDADGASSPDDPALAGMSAAERAETFAGAPVGRRMLTVAAGPVANFLLSIVVFAGLGLWQGVPAGDATVGEVVNLPGEPPVPLQAGDRIVSVEGTPVAALADLYAFAHAREASGPLQVTVMRDGARRTLTIPHPLPPLVQGVEPLSAASEAGLRAGDLIRAADGERLRSFADLQQAVSGAEGPITLTIARGDAVIERTLEPREVERLDAEGNVERRVMIGVAGGALIRPAIQTPTPWGAVALGVERVWEVISGSLTGIGLILTQQLGVENLNGPVGIAMISGDVAQQGALNLINLIAVISTAVGLLNLFPIPVLDGGHLMFFAYEAAAGRPPSPGFQRIAMTVGLTMVLLLMLVATYNDVFYRALS